MSMKMAVIGAFLINTLIGGVCMMPMAMASGVPMQHEVNEMMTPMSPVSHTDCEHCPHYEEKKELVPQSSSCAGHCLTQATSSTRSNIVLGSTPLLAALPPTLSVEWRKTEDMILLPSINASPPLLSTDFVVLRL